MHGEGPFLFPFTLLMQSQIPDWNERLGGKETANG